MLAAVRAEAEHQVGVGQRLGQAGGHGAQLHGVGTRFQHRQDASRPDLAAQPFQGGGDGGGVVGEIVVDLHAVDGAAQFHAALDPGKAGQGLDALFRGHAHVLGRCQRRQRIHAVVLAPRRTRPRHRVA
ncbi:hypothetical protein G6F23_014254 [Rhizopus arrhizus]|nr:hypothetical protein G6F23_014254 [Rhizopus arrhizus]